MRTGGKSIGMAALASAWCGPMWSARKSVRGGAVCGMSTSGAVCMKTTVRPVETSVVETVSARSCVCAALARPRAS